MLKLNIVIKLYKQINVRNKILHGILIFQNLFLFIKMKKNINKITNLFKCKNFNKIIILIWNSMVNNLVG
jgi:hypothetical protein